MVASSIAKESVWAVTRVNVWFIAVLLVVLLLAGVLLALTGGLSYVAPFVYTLF